MSKKRALISVSDKSGLTDFAKFLEEKNYEFLRIDENEVSMEKKISKDSVKIILKGKDNGIYIETQFLKDKGIWKLESYNDQST